MDHAQLFTDTSLACSKLITQRYSTSFSLGIRTLDERLHAPVYAVYGFVRWADEIVDTFHGHDRAALLADFQRQTAAALAARLSLNPVLHAFQAVVHEYGIDQAFIDAFLRSMALDLEDQELPPGPVQGVHLRLGRGGGAHVPAHLLPRAAGPVRAVAGPRAAAGGGVSEGELPARHPLRLRGPGPGVLSRRGLPAVRRRCRNARLRPTSGPTSRPATSGIQRLPRPARLGVYLAYVYYLKLFYKIKNLPAAHILHQRVRVPTNTKLLLLLGSYFRFRLARL